MEFAELIKTPKLDKVVLYQPFCKPMEGSLCLTGHHLIVASRNELTDELWLLHQMVDVVEKKIAPTTASVILKCKDFRILQLDIPTVEECLNVAYSIECLSQIETPRLLYPFFHRALFEIQEDGWTAFPLENYFASIKLHTDDWKMSFVNNDYSVCDTYPQALIVPKIVEDESLAIVSSFRQGGRIPVLSYFHKEKKTVLLRSSQPMIGPNNRRCREDEKLINSVLDSSKKGYIIDLRTQNMAQLARTKGGGFEIEMHYPLWKRIHRPIDKQSNLLDSLSKLIEASNDTSCSVDKWLSRLESCGWLNAIKDVLTCACVVAQCIEQDGASVLVHGTEGIDSTLVICSLSQVILDSDCRTIRGFEALIEREWLLAGYPFASRSAHGPYSTNARSKEQNPTFLMFLDCVFQIHEQFPCSFEFNEQFLLMLYEHSCASQFGTFLCNCDKDRKGLSLSAKTVSLWSYIHCPDVLSKYLNPVYDPNNSVIWPSVAPQSLVLWSNMYLRWICNPANQVNAWETIAEIKQKEKDLRFKVTRLRRQVLELEKEAVELGVVPATTPCAPPSGAL